MNQLILNIVVDLLPSEGIFIRVRFLAYLYNLQLENYQMSYNCCMPRHAVYQRTTDSVY